MVETDDNEALLRLPQSELKKIWGKETRPHDTQRIKDIRKEFINKLGKNIEDFLSYNPKPKTLQEIPPMAKALLGQINFPSPDEVYTTSKGNPRTFLHAKASTELVQLALELAKKSNLLRAGMDLPLRRLWYAFIKATLERGLEGYVYGAGGVLGQQRVPEDGDYTNSFSDIIKNTDLWYSTYGVKNPSATVNIKSPKLFKPILIGLEKRSYFDVLKNMSQLLGFSIYSAGGQSKFAEQENLAKRLKSDIFDQYPEYEDVDVYIISDYDPAGLDIAINIGKHQKFYQNRFGKDVNVIRLAPLPKHYDDDELERGIYTVAGNTVKRATWNPKPWDEYDDEEALEKKNVIMGVNEGLLEEREKYDLEPKDGLEVESLPDQPLEDILENPPTDWGSQDYDDLHGGWKGLSRMKFILFDELIERYGLEGALSYFINQKTDPKSTWGDAYNIENLANKLIEKGEAKDIETEIYEPYSTMSSIDDLVKRFVNDYLESDKEEVRKQIEEWFEDTIAKYTDKEHEDYDESITDDLKEDLMNKLYYAVSRDKSYITLPFPEEYKISKVKDADGDLYEDDFIINIPDDIIDNMRPIINWAKCMNLNAQTVYDYLEELDDPLEYEWEIPPVRSCTINDDGEAEFSESVITETYIQVDYCEKEKQKIRELNDFNTELLSKISKLERELEECLEEKGTEPDKDLELYITKIEKELREVKKNLQESEDELAEVSVEFDKKITELDELKKTKDLKAVELELKITELNAQLKKKGGTAASKKIQERLDDCLHKLKGLKTEKTLLEYQLGKAKAAVPKMKVMFGEEEVDVSKVIAEELMEREEFIGWRKKPMVQRGYLTPAGFEDPFAWFSWDSAANKETDVIELQVENIEQLIAKDNPQKKKIETEKLDKVRDYIKDIKKPSPTFHDLSTAHREINRILKTLSKIHFNL